MTTSIDEAPSTTRRQALDAHVLLVAPSFGYWRGYYQLPKSITTVQLSGRELDNGAVTTPRVRLLTDAFPLDSAGVAWKKRFQALETQKNATVERWSVPFPISGVRIVPRRAATDFLQELHQLELTLADTVNEFVLQYDDVVAQMRANVETELFRHAYSRASFPHNQNQMRSKFYIDVVPVEIATPNNQDATAEVVGLPELQAYQALVQEATQRKVEEAIESMIAAPRRQLATAIESLKDVIGRNGRVSSKSFRPVYEAMRKIRAFEFVCNEELLAEMQALEHRMDGTEPRMLDQAAAAHNGFTAALDALLAEVDNDEKACHDLEEFGRYRRALDV